MSKQEEAGLILKLYELRREEVMRKARDWYFRDFNPQNFGGFQQRDDGGAQRLFADGGDVLEYGGGAGDDGAISMELFNESNGEQIGVFAKVEPLLGEIRATYGPQFAVGLGEID